LRFGVFESLSFFFPILFLRDRRDVRQLVLSFVILSIALSAKVLLGLLYASDRVLSGDKDITQIGDGMLLGIALLMTFGNIELSKAMKRVVVPVLSFGLIACAARSPLVALLITVPIMLLCAKNEMRRVIWKSIWVGGILIVLVAIPSLMWLQTLPFAEQKLFGKEAELQSALSGQIFLYGTFAQRLSFYRSSLEAMAEHPIGGVGSGGWSIFYDNADSPRFPHNFVLEVGAEQGLIGLSVLLALLALLFRRALRLFRSNPYWAFVFPVFVFCVVLNLITGDIESRPLWFCCGLVAAASRFSLPIWERDSVAEPQHQLEALSVHA
jgi:O-antigen ligase